MANIQITVSGTTIGDVTRIMTNNGAMSDALMAEMFIRYGKDTSGNDIPPADACGIALEKYLLSTIAPPQISSGV